MRRFGPWKGGEAGAIRGAWRLICMGMENIRRSDNGRRQQPAPEEAGRRRRAVRRGTGGRGWLGERSNRTNVHGGKATANGASGGKKEPGFAPRGLSLFKTRDMQILPERQIRLISSPPHLPPAIFPAYFRQRTISREEIQNCNSQANMQIPLWVPGETRARSRVAFFFFFFSLFPDFRLLPSAVFIPRR